MEYRRWEIRDKVRVFEKISAKRRRTDLLLDNLFMEVVEHRVLNT